MRPNIRTTNTESPASPAVHTLTIDSAREFLVEFMMQHFTDKCFHRYIRGQLGRISLAGDFAWQMATALKAIAAGSASVMVDRNKVSAIDKESAVQQANPTSPLDSATLLINAICECCDPDQANSFESWIKSDASFAGRLIRCINNHQDAGAAPASQHDATGAAKRSVEALKTFSVFPITDPDKNMDAVNMKLIAADALVDVVERTASASPVDPVGAAQEQSIQPTRLDVMSLIRSQMHRSYTAGHEGGEIDPKYIVELEDAIMGIYHRRYISAIRNTWWKELDASR